MEEKCSKGTTSPQRGGSMEPMDPPRSAYEYNHSYPYHTIPLQCITIHAQTAPTTATTSSTTSTVGSSTPSMTPTPSTATMSEVMTSTSSPTSTNPPETVNRSGKQPFFSFPLLFILSLSLSPSL